MAFIPDEAIFRMREISPPAFQLYAYYCMKRNHQTGGFECPLSLVVSETGMNKGQVYKLNQQLVEAGWITREGNFTRPLVGTFQAGKIQPVALSNQDGCPQQPELPVATREVAHSNQKVAHSNQNGFPQQPHIRNTSHVPANNQPVACMHARVREVQGTSSGGLPGEDFTEHPAVAVYREMLGELHLNGQEFIAHSGIEDLDLWREVLMLWKANDHRRHKTWNIVDRYRNELSRRQQESTGTVEEILAKAQLEYEKRTANRLN